MPAGSWAKVCAGPPGGLTGRSGNTRIAGGTVAPGAGGENLDTEEDATGTAASGHTPDGSGPAGVTGGKGMTDIAVRP
ncbi:hypothetical protein [Streptomyces sp. NPDC014623]|uniref:hypothetical protein n=1 Tax=Streptomyces sp. NPDC014623 TaxID=3364875 RepID=UPI0036F7F09E